MKKTMLHVHNHASRLTFCGKARYTKWPVNVHLASTDALFGGKPQQPHEVICKECSATDEYQERYALWLLGEYA